MQTEKDSHFPKNMRQSWQTRIVRFSLEHTQGCCRVWRWRSTRCSKLSNPAGTVFIADMAGGESFADNINHPMGRFFYNVSVLHCLPQAMVFPESVGTGTAISENEVRTYAHEAGYSNTLVLEIENPFYRFYQLQP